MHLTTLDISPDEAAERLKEYEAQLAGERTVEDDAIRAGYRAAARGLPVIHLPTVIEQGGRFPNGLPRLAVVRAIATECFVDVRHPGSWGGNGPDTITYCDKQRDQGRVAVGKHRVAVRVPYVPIDRDDRTNHGRTIVPLIPPTHRPGRYRLHLFHILWEVEKWDPTPPVDPALLRHIRGDLWSVVATWDLTDLERAVLAARGGSA
jgi:hypothetical protein